MTTLPLGIDAYKREYAREPEIRLVNRFVETAPTNLKEHTALLTRPGTKHLVDAAPDTIDGRYRCSYFKSGLFEDDLFFVMGHNLYRYNGTDAPTHIIGVIHGADAPRVTWSKGGGDPDRGGYQFLWIADGQALYYYGGGTHADGVLTYDGSGAFATDVLVIGGAYYGWGASMTDPLADGSSAHPFVAINTGTSAQLLAQMVAMLNFTGTPGVDFSSTLGGPSPDVTAESDALTMTLHAISSTAEGDTITTTLKAGSSGNLSWSAATLVGGGVEALHQVAMPDGKPALSVASLDAYVYVSVGNSQMFFWLQPGEVAIDALNFAEKESSPDPIIDMATVGDIIVIAGAGSTEFWSATGQDDAPIAPIQGRTAQRGIVPGTLVVTGPGTYMAVGSDWKVYDVGATPRVVSKFGIDERIRKQLRREYGLAP